MRLVFLMNEGENKDYASYYRKSDDIVFPIDPASRRDAIKRNWKILETKSLWDEKIYFSEKKKSEESIKKLIESLNELSWQTSPAGKEISIGDYYSFVLMINMGMIHYNIFIIKSIIDTKRFCSYAIYKKDKPLLDANGLFDDADYLLMESACNFICKEKLLILHRKIYHINSQEVISVALAKSFLKRIIPEGLRVFLHNFIALINDIVKLNFLGESKIKLLALAPLYDWDALLSSKEFKKIYYVKVVKFIYSKKYNNRCDKIINLLKGSSDYQLEKYSSLNGLGERIEEVLYDITLHHKKYTNNIKKYSGLLTTVHVSPHVKYYCHIATRLDIPVINWQHGEMALYLNDYEYSTETQYTTHYFAYSDNVKKHYEQAIQNVYKVGSTKKSIKHKSEKLIVYATGKWMKNGAPFIRSVDPDKRLYDAQEVLLTYLDELAKSHKVVVKLNQPPQVVSKEVSHLTLDYSTPFTELLEQAYIVILDVPATTCIETASTNTPLFVLSGRVDWYKEPMQALEKRAVVESSPEELIKKIDKYIVNGEYVSNVYDKRFLNGWGSSLSSSESATKALDALGHIVSSSPH